MIITMTISVWAVTDKMADSTTAVTREFFPRTGIMRWVAVSILGISASGVSGAKEGMIFFMRIPLVMVARSILARAASALTRDRKLGGKRSQLVLENSVSNGNNTIA